MGLGKQAKTLTKHQQDAVLQYIKGTRYPVRNKVIFLLSIKAGLRAKEIAKLNWSMCTDAQGRLSDAISLQNSASKGRSGGVVWLNRALSLALEDLRKLANADDLNGFVIKTERNIGFSPQAIVNMMRGWYVKLGFDGCSSHSGRRTFITNAARKISSVGGSIKDVQMLARHSSLQMTQRYIEHDIEAQKKIVNLV